MLTMGGLFVGLFIFDEQITQRIGTILNVVVYMETNFILLKDTKNGKIDVRLKKKCEMSVRPKNTIRFNRFKKGQSK